MKKIILLMAILALLCAGCTPYSELVPETPLDVVEVAMYVVSGGSSPEHLVLGPNGEPAVLSAPTGIGALISQQLSYEVVSLTENGDTATAVLNITSPDAVSLVYQALDGMQTYDEEAFVAQMERLLSDAPPTKVFQVNVELVKVDGTWCIQVNEEFSNAVTGGLIAEYSAVQQRILEAYLKGGEG